MRNVRCSGRLSCHACPLPCMPLPHMASSLCMPPPLPHMPPLPHTPPSSCMPPLDHAHLRAMHTSPLPHTHTHPAMHTSLPCMSLAMRAHHCHTCPPPLPHMPPLTMHAFLPRMSPCGQNDRRLWKHYLSPTTVADGKNLKVFVESELVIRNASFPCWLKTTELYLP